AILGYLSKNPDREPGAGERLASDDLFGKRELAADSSNFVFEQLPKRLDQPKMHLLRQASYVVMRLYHRRWSFDRHRFDHVRIERSLHRKGHVTEVSRFPLKDLDEFFSDDLSLSFRIGHARQRRQEPLAGGDADYVQMHVAIRVEHFFKLALSQQACVDKD